MSYFINPQTRLISTKPNCANTSVSSDKLGQNEFGKDNFSQLAKQVFPS